MNVEIHRNAEFIQSVPFNEYNGLSYADHYVYILIKPEFDKESIPLNTYRADAQTAKDFVLTVADVWTLMIKKYKKQNDFQSISV